ncbi:tRNA (N(6)-L-threonylcarbamoyladenosine(37)-C(2))-methylthiotransferase MtaB [Candidatus Epulonipiscioides gigas]|nr:tRNA (N(6)-L-threonylcarbamoyladenosine(37)-C(2))-methylthiotransferase MtaB [Epulopiscium sp. SCG-C07WGA-EpuloA2]
MENKLKKTIAVYTLGCKVNQYDTDAVVELFEKKGYTLVDFDAPADVYIVNTCTVTHLSDRKCRQMLRRTKKINPNSTLVAMGCYAQISKEKIKEEVEEIDIVIGTDNRKNIVNIIENLIPPPISDIMQVNEFEELEISTTNSKTRSYLKIQEGCNNYCSYCIIPYVRGKIRSRKENNIINEAIRLSNAGFKEIVLTGIHVASYGKDLENTNLVTIIKKIAEIEGIKRIRLSSIEPNIVNDDFINMLQTTPKLCNHFHLSLQSGSDTVLKRMNRKYTTNMYLESVEKIRKVLPNVGLTTDIIVGFPQETKKEFQETLDFVNKIGFLDIHIFPYSIRKGTRAAQMSGQIASNIKEERAKQLQQLQTFNRNKFLDNIIGKEVMVLFENSNTGFTNNYIKVKVNNNKELINQIIKIKIEKREDNILIGEIVL